MKNRIVVVMLCAGAALPLAAAVPQRANAPPSAASASEQATLGRSVFERSCRSCHTADPARPAAADLPEAVPIALAGPRFMAKWHSAADLFSKISQTMPIDATVGVGGLPRQEYVALVAYLLQVNGRLDGRSLPADQQAMKRFRVDGGGAPAPAARASNAGSGAGYYTEQQAERGRLYFNGACALCHVAGSESPTIGLTTGLGFLTGRGRNRSNVAGANLAERWQHVGRLFDKVRTTMPAYDYGGLSDETYVDIVAYLLKAGGLPSGSRELAGDPAPLRAMTLPEPGFEPVFNGHDFSGLRFLVGNNCAPRPRGCGQTEPGSTFRIDNGAIVSSGRPQGYMYTDQRYLDFTLRFDYRYTPVPGLEEGTFFGNSGYMLFVTEHQVWPVMVEIQGANASVLGIISSARPAKFTVDADARARVLRRLGEWNSIEIVSSGGQIRSSLNGTLVSTVTEHQFREPGHIGFQSEGAEISWRNIRIKRN